ncbi:hypothetical protein R1sor_004188 [Riccia sorocarpa]|uniref:Uncharacterized protein n=1 Tax=Riccia sorocarpa TaxID=122646 RepID=A0ABD3H5N7_9MARC
MKGEAFEKGKAKAYERELEQTKGMRVFKRPRQQDPSSIAQRALPPRKKLAALNAAAAQQRVGCPSETEEQLTRDEMPSVSEAVEASSDRCNRSSHNVSTQSATPSLSAAPSCELDIVWPKLLALREKHLNETRELFALLEIRSTMPISPGQLSKLKQYKEVLYRIIPYLTVPKEKIPKEFNLEKAQLLENEIVRIVNTFQRRRQVSLLFRRQLEEAQTPDLRLPCQDQQQQQQDHFSPTQQIQLSENRMYFVPNCSSPRQSK